MPSLNIAFDARTPSELVAFVCTHIAPLSSEKQSRIHIKVNDLLAEVGLSGLKNLAEEIWIETGIDIAWMIDGKWNDIPNTVANYVKRLDGLNVAYYTVHASGGPEMIRVAKKAAPDIKLLAITVLTSLQESEVREIYGENRENTILRLAYSALSAWADGLVCSPADAPMLRAVFGEYFLLVTPNITTEWMERNDDQNKLLTNTPKGAIENGASDIVVGRPILTAKNPGELIGEILGQMRLATKKPTKKDYELEKLLYRGSWEELLKYIGAIYRRPENGDYVRLASGFLSDTYINVGATERDYRVLARATVEIGTRMLAKNIRPDLVIGAQMGSVRLSLALAESMSIPQSIYTEKQGNDMLLLRHNLWEGSLQGKKVVLSEDVITKGSTLAKMIEIIRAGGGEVVAITCLVNRTGRDDYAGIPLFYCYVPPAFGMWWDAETLEKTRSNEQAIGKDPSTIETIIKNIKSSHSPLPASARISEKPKNEWLRLVQSMRNEM